MDGQSPMVNKRSQQFLNTYVWKENQKCNTVDAITCELKDFEQMRQQTFRFAVLVQFVLYKIGMEFYLVDCWNCAAICYEVL